jgi:hypothetical protein
LFALPNYFIANILTFPPNLPLKKHIFTKPEFDIFEVAVESGYGNSTSLPGFGSEEDELTY